MFVLIHFHILCEIRAYIYEKVVKCFYDFFRVANSFSVFYDSFYATFLFVFLRYNFIYSSPNTSNIILIFIKFIVIINSKILNSKMVSWSVYPNYEYHYFTMYLVHLWLVEITCRLECISAAAKWSPGRPMRPIKWSGDPDIPNYRSDWRIEKFSCQSPCPNFWLSKYTVLVSIFLYRTAQNYCGPPRVPSGWSTGRTRIFR